MVFFANGNAKLVSPQLRKDIVRKLQSLDGQLMNYLVILEANDDPCGVVDRFAKEVIDEAFD